MMKLNQRKRNRLDRAADRVQPAMMILGELSRAISDGRPVCRQLMLIEELSGLLLEIEDSVGVVTAPALFA